MTTSALGAALVAYAGFSLIAQPLSVPARFEVLARAGRRRRDRSRDRLHGRVRHSGRAVSAGARPRQGRSLQALGLSFTVSTIALATGLASHGAWRLDNLALSSLAIVPSLAGMRAGQVVRSRVSPATFRRWFLIALVALGAEMTLRPLLAG